VDFKEDSHAFNSSILDPLRRYSTKQTKVKEDGSEQFQECSVPFDENGIL
jgi:hypothetical protein